MSLFVIFVDWFFQIWTKNTGFGVKNSGVSFGVGFWAADYLRYLVFILVCCAFYLVLSKKHRGKVFLLALLIGGVGNAIPRLVWGFVWDYIHIPVIELWINLSDVLISTAALSYILVDADADTNHLRN